MAKEGGASHLPLCLSSVVEGEHGQDNEDHQQHRHPGSHEPVDQAFLDAPVASLSAVPVRVGGQAADVGEGQRGKRVSHALASWVPNERCKFEESSEEMNLGACGGRGQPRAPPTWFSEDRSLRGCSD